MKAIARRYELTDGICSVLHMRARVSHQPPIAAFDASSPATDIGKCPRRNNFPFCAPRGRT
jgi:hypothetical protein